MGEDIVAGYVADLADEGREVGRIEDVEQLVLGAVGDRRQDFQVEIAPDHGGQREHLLGRVAQPANPGSDDLAHAVGQEPGLLMVLAVRDVGLAGPS